MAGFRIDINDGRNKPVAPLEPPGGGAVPVTASAQSNNEATDANVIGAIITGGAQDGVTATYNSGTRTVDLTNTDKGSVAVTNHVADTDPHGDRAYADSLLAGHLAAADPHPEYLTPLEADALYAAIDHDLGDHGDVDLTGLADGDILYWDSGTNTWLPMASPTGGGGASFSEFTTGGSIDLSDLVDGEIRLLHLTSDVTDVTWPTITAGNAARYTILIEAVGADRDIVEFLLGQSADYSTADTLVPQDYYATLQVDAVDSVRSIEYIDWQGANGYASGGVSDHGALTGLADDDHTQYHNDTRGDVRYYTKTQIDADWVKKDGSVAMTGALQPASDQSTDLGATTKNFSVVWARQFVYEGNDGLYINAANASGYVVFRLASVDQAIISTAGNMRLGGTPYAWGSSFRAFECGDGAFGGGGGGTRMVNNAYHDGTNWTYKVTAGVVAAQCETGGFYIYTAPSGTAGTTATLTERMRVSLDGDLGLGEAPSSSYRLTIGKTGATAGVRINGATGFQSTLEFATGGTLKQVMGVSGAAGAIINDASVGDMNYRTNATNHHWSVNNGSTAALTLHSDGRLSGKGLHNNGTVTGTTNQFIASGSYTPTPTNVTNVSATTMNTCYWIRVGNVVHVHGSCSIDPTSTSAATVIRFTLPIASGLASFAQLTGTAVRGKNTTATICGYIGGDATNDAANLSFFCDGDAAAHTWYFTFSYIIV